MSKKTRLSTVASYIVIAAMLCSCSGGMGNLSGAESNDSPPPAQTETSQADSSGTEGTGDIAGQQEYTGASQGNQEGGSLDSSQKGNFMRGRGKSTCPNANKGSGSSGEQGSTDTNSSASSKGGNSGNGSSSGSGTGGNIGGTSGSAEQGDSASGSGQSSGQSAGADSNSSSSTGSAKAFSGAFAQDPAGFNQRMLELLNAKRKELGAQPLSLDQELIDFAKRKAEAGSAANATGSNTHTVGEGVKYAENAAPGWGEDATPEALFKAFVTDEEASQGGHFKNAMNPSSSKTGIYGVGGFYYQEFK